jgi:type I restriction enzyme S subunit
MAELVSLGREVVNPGDSPDEVFDHYSIPAFDEDRWPKEEAGKEIKSNKFLVPRDGVLLSKLNPRLPRVWLPTVSGLRRSIASTEFLVASPQQGFSRAYTFALFNSQGFLDVFESLVTGTSGSHQRVKPEFLLAMDVIVPSPQCAECFARVVGPLYEKTAKNLAESRNLASIRDALLPKLISGEIRMRDAEKAV